MLMDMTVDEGIEDELRIPFVVAYLSLIRQTVSLLYQA